MISLEAVEEDQDHFLRDHNASFEP